MAGCTDAATGQAAVAVDAKGGVPPYDVAVDGSNAVLVTMTLTAPGCPAAQSLPSEVESKVRAVPGVTAAKVDVVWEPGWTKDRMSEAAKLQLGMW